MWKTGYPKNNGEYLVTRKFCKTHIVEIVSYANNLHKIDEYDFYNKKEYSRCGWYNYSSEYGYYEIKDIIAWTELPNPYIEEKEKNANETNV